MVAIEGASAVGKTTVAAALGRAGWSVVGEAYDRLDRSPDLGVPTPADLRSVERRLLAEEVRRSRAAVRRRDRGADVVLDTAPFGPATYSLGLARRNPEFADAAREIADDLLRRLAEQRLIVPDRVVYLVAPAATRRRRAKGSPARHPGRWAERHLAVGRFEYRFWREVARRAPGSVRFVEASVAETRVLALVARALARPGRRLSRSALRPALKTARASVRRHR